MRVTIFGATGLLGNALMREWRGDEVTGLGSRDADIRSYDQVAAAIQKHRPEWVVLAAGYTDVDGCETNRDLAFDVNCQGAVNVAKATAQAGARLIFLSTDYVRNRDCCCLAASGACASDLERQVRTSRQAAFVFRPISDQPAETRHFHADLAGCPAPLPRGTPHSQIGLLPLSRTKQGNSTKPVFDCRMLVSRGTYVGSMGQ